MKVYIIGGNKELVNFLPDTELVDDIKQAKLVIFGPGPIVSPSLYGEKKVKEVDLKCDINRDRSDKSIYVKLKPEQIILGIDRGACFLSVMNGAKLIQQVVNPNPDYSQEIKIQYGDKSFVFSALSNITQAINLKTCDNFELLGVSHNLDYVTDNETRRFMRANGNPEIIKFHKANSPLCLCVQFHPEWMPESYLSKLLKEIIYAYAD